MPHPIDLYIGKRLREARRMRGLSQQAMGGMLGHPVSFQQVQKYERGVNRIAASTLCEFAHALNLPVRYFLPVQSGAAKRVLCLKDVRWLEGIHALPSATQNALFTLLRHMKS